MRRRISAMSWKAFLCLTTAIIIIYFLTHSFFSNLHQHVDYKSLIKQHYTQWPSFEIMAHYNRDFSSVCLEGTKLPTGIESFLKSYSIWEKSEDPLCKKLLWSFNLVFNVRSSMSRPISIPKDFSHRVMEWLGGNKKLYKSLQTQHLIHIYNRFTSEHSVYNPVRASRPLPTGAMGVWEYVDKVAKDTAHGCDFCNYVNQTAVDELGRQATESTVRMSNTFKVERWHGLVISRQVHHPVNLTAKVFIDMLQDGIKWTRQIQQVDPEFRYPSLAWDTLFKAGVSQVHPHIHVMAAPNHYYGSLEQMRSVGQEFLQLTDHNFFSFLAGLHLSLGLAVTHGSAVAISTLAGKTDLEVIILGADANTDVFQLTYIVVKTFQEKFSQLCHSIGMAFPAIGDESSDSSLGRIPAIIRIGSRSDCQSKKNDISSLEIFEMNYRDHDPWQLSRAIHSTKMKYTHTHKFKFR